MDNRSLTPEQVDAVRRLLPTLSTRDRLLWLLSYHTAGRISATLSLRIHDVADGATVRPFLTIARRHLKGGRGPLKMRRRVNSRHIPIHPAVAEAIREHLEERRRDGTCSPDAHLFASAQGGEAISVMQAWRIFRRIYAAIGVTGPGFGTHVTRRTAARTLYARTKDIELVRAALGHQNVNTTMIYLRASDQEAGEALLGL